MTHDTFGTTNLDTVATWIFEAGWDHEAGTIYRKDYRGQTLRGTLEMRDGYYALRAI